jgi:hypothetical protein
MQTENLPTEVFNQRFIDKLEAGEVKTAADAGTSFIRRKLREDGFLRKIIPPQPLGNQDLDRVIDHDKPVRIEDFEPNVPAAKAVPFGEIADMDYFYGPKFLVPFARILTPEETKDIDELRTYRMDIRRILMDNMLKDMMSVEDGTFISAVDAIVGAANSTVAATGLVQHVGINAALTNNRPAYAAVLKILENAKLNNGTILMNRITAKAFLTFDRTVLGGDLSERIFTDGLSAIQEARIFGVRHLFTIKREIVPDNVVYVFAEPQYLGKFYTLQDATVHMEKKKYFIKFMAYETIGAAIGNIAGVAKVTFNAPTY